jgi:hypothetical protein
VFATSERQTEDELAPAVQRPDDELPNCCDSELDATRKRRAVRDIAAAVVKRACSGGGACIECDVKAHEAKTQRCIGFAMSGAQQDQVNRPAPTDACQKEAAYARVRLNAWLGVWFIGVQLRPKASPSRLA